MKRLLWLVGTVVMGGMQTSCIGAWIYTTGKDVKQPETRAAAREKFGTPVITQPVGLGDPLLTEIFHRDSRPAKMKSYEVYFYRGLVADEQAASGAATLNAVTLGTGEVIATPFAVLDRATTFADTHYYFAGFDSRDRVIEYRELKRAERKRVEQKRSTGPQSTATRPGKQ